MRRVQSPAFEVESVAVPALGGTGDASRLPLDALRKGLRDGAAQAIYLCFGESDLAILDLLPLLSATERARARRASEQSLAVKFVVGRWLLRSILGAILDLSPEEIPLGVGPHGKPMLERDFPGCPSFNLAHSGAWAVLAIATGTTVGVDLERIRPLADADRLARRILTPREQEHYRRLARSARESALLTAWVGKEAVLKALGAGISGSPASIEVGLDPVAVARPVGFLAATVPPVPWFLCELTPPSGYLGVIALEGAPRPLLSWQAHLATLWSP